jgi:predicted transcriptional regulator
MGRDGAWLQRGAVHPLVAEACTEVARAREGLAEAIVRAYVGGMRHKDIAGKTGYTRETIRTILRRAGIEPD